MSPEDQNTEEPTQDTESTGPTIEIPEPQEAADDTQDTAPPERPDRKTRRGEWLRETKDRAAKADSLEKQLGEERLQRERIDRELAELRGRQQASDQFRQQSPAADPYEGRLKELKTKAQMHLSASAQAKDPATAQRELDAYHEALDAASDVRAERMFDKRKGEFTANQPDVDAIGMKTTLAAEYPWLRSNQKAVQAADGYLNILLAQGKPDDLNTFREACALSAKDFKLGGHEKPNPQQKQRYAGVPGNNGGGGEGDGARTFVMDDATKAVALAWCNRQGIDYKDDRDAAKKWAARVLNQK